MIFSVIYNMYLQLGVDGLRGLENYDPITKVCSYLVLPIKLLTG